MITRILTAALFLSPAFSYAAEADHFTLGSEDVQDITYELNDYVNTNVARILTELNRDGGCTAPAPKAPSPFPEDEYNNEKPETPDEKLYEALKEIFSNHSRSTLIKGILDGEMPRTVIPLKESVYGEWSIGNGFLLGRDSAAKSPLALSPLIKVNGLIIGADKLEHMFGMGYAYFKRHHLKGQSLKRVLKKGVIAEKTYLGGNMLATGVFAYADLSANFNGMRFWNHILQKQDDVLGAQHNLGPYITCDNGQWRKAAKAIDFSDYVDKSYQENVNCSKFATQKGLDKFQGSLVRLKAKHGKARSFSCPSSMAELEEAAAKYEVPLKGGGTIGHWFINREGAGKLSYFNEF